MSARRLSFYAAFCLGIFLTVGALVSLPALWRGDEGAPPCQVSSPAGGESVPQEGDEPRLLPPQPLDFIYTWNLHRSPSQTTLEGDLAPDAFSLLEAPVWRIRIQTNGTHYSLHGEEAAFHAKQSLSRVAVRTRLFHQATVVRRMPSGRLHRQHLVTLECQADVHPPLFGKTVSTRAQQTLLIDGEAGSIDLVPPVAESPGSRARQTIISSEPSGLPERYAGTATEKEMQRILDTLACIRTPALAQSCAPWLVRHTQALVETQEQPNEPWPRCWGREAEMARQLSRRVEPTLLHLQENDCFGSQELADYINSPLFSLLFGDGESHAPAQEDEL